MREHGIVIKGWGHEEIWVSNDDYCSKYMHFHEGGKTSMHFHKEKHEAWRVIEGKFQVNIIIPLNAATFTYYLENGQTYQIEPMTPHQLICLEAGIVLEVSTPDSVEDNYRIIPGDSQK